MTELVHNLRPAAGEPEGALVMLHGRGDPVIGIEFARAARAALSAAPVDLTYHEHEGAHHVDPRLLAELPAWVERAMDAAAATAS